MTSLLRRLSVNETMILQPCRTDDVLSEINHSVLLRLGILGISSNKNLLIVNIYSLCSSRW